MAALKNVLTAMLAVLFLSGCWDVTSIETIGFVTLMGVDYSRGQYHVALQEVVPTRMPSGTSSGKSGEGGGGGSSGRTTHTLNGTGKNIYEAVRNSHLSTSKRPYFGQIEAVLFTDRLAKTVGVSPIVDFLLRNPKSRMIPYVGVISPDVMPKIAEVQPKNAAYPARAFDDLSNHETEDGDLLPERFYQLAEQIVSPGHQALVPEVKLRNGDLTYAGDYLFRTDRLAGKLSDTGINGYAWLSGMPLHAPLSIECGPSQTIAFEASQLRRNIVPKVQSGDLRGMDIKIDATLRYAQDSGCPPLANYGPLAAAKIAHVATQALYEAQAQKSDVFGLGDIVKAKLPLIWANNKHVWNDKVFPSLPIGVHVAVRMDGQGLFSSSDPTQRPR